MRIVVIRHGAIGDTLITFPILRALRAKYATDHITFVSNPSVVPLAHAFGLVDEVFAPNQDQWLEFFSPDGLRSPQWLRLFQQTDLVFNLMRHKYEFMLQHLLAAGVKKVIGSDPPPSLLFNHLVTYMAKSIGLPEIRADNVAPFTFTDMQPAFSSHDAPIAVHPSSSRTEEQTWPTASFAAVINRLLHLGQPVLLLAGPLDANQLDGVRRRLAPAQTGLLTQLINAPILEVARRIQQCKCYLGNDSGITHLAGLLGVPTIVLFGPGGPAIWRPLGPAVEVIQKNPLKRLSVKRVFASVAKYI